MLRPLKIIQKYLKKGLGIDRTNCQMLVLLSKIEGIDTFKANNLHQNGVKNLSKKYNALYKIQSVTIAIVFKLIYYTNGHF